MKIALVHDYLREYGGAERVVEALHEMWPRAPLYTSFVDKEALGQHWQRFADWDIRTSWVQQNWLVKKFHSPLRFLAPKIWGSFDLSSYDVVISSSGWFMCRGVALDRSKTRSHESHEASHAFQPSPARRDDQPLHICYIHHPPRNLYGYATGSCAERSLSHAQRGSDFQKYWPVRVYAAIVNFFLRMYDWETAQRVDYFIANSEETKRRVWKFYRREAAVIYPPINDGISNFQFPISKQIQNSKSKIQNEKTYYLSVGRLTYSKRVDLAIEAANKLKLELKIVGSGKEEPYLRSIAGPTVEFLGSVSDQELSGLYEGAKALIFCALDEDFGMVPVEAMAHGVPVVALGQGGVLETVVDGKTGVLFRKPTVESLVGEIRKFNKNYNRYNSNNCYKQAKKFSKEQFQKTLRAFVEKAYAGKLTPSHRS